MSSLHWLALAGVPRLGGTTARRLLERFGTVEAILEAPEWELRSVPRVSAEMAARIRKVSLQAASLQLQSLTARGLRVVTWEDEGYPENLRGLPDAPPVLYLRGELQPHDGRAVAIVGSRHASERGTIIAATLACELARRGLTVVSGLALGIDAAAHRGAMRAPEGRTLAVLGCGLDRVYPPEHTLLARRVARCGALLSDLPTDALPVAQHLMARDRIVSGLARAVIVVEARPGGGSVDTAMKARRQGRPVFAVPGSPGTAALLASGAGCLDPHCPDLDRLCHCACRSQAGEPTTQGAEGDRGREGRVAAGEGW